MLTQVGNSLLEERKVYIRSQVAFPRLMEHIDEFVIFESLVKPAQPTLCVRRAGPAYSERISMQMITAVINHQGSTAQAGALGLCG